MLRQPIQRHRSALFGHITQGLDGDGVILHMDGIEDGGELRYAKYV